MASKVKVSLEHELRSTSSMNKTNSKARREITHDEFNGEERKSRRVAGEEKQTSEELASKDKNSLRANVKGSAKSRRRRVENRREY